MLIRVGSGSATLLRIHEPILYCAALLKLSSFPLFQDENDQNDDTNEDNENEEENNEENDDEEGDDDGEEDDDDDSWEDIEVVEEVGGDGESDASN